jgi:hypothetical protein
VTTRTAVGSAAAPAAIVGSPVKTAMSPMNVATRHCVKWRAPSGRSSKMSIAPDSTM